MFYIQSLSDVLYWLLHIEYFIFPSLYIDSMLITFLWSVLYTQLLVFMLVLVAINFMLNKFLSSALITFTSIVVVEDLKHLYAKAV